MFKKNFPLLLVFILIISILLLGLKINNYLFKSSNTIGHHLDIIEKNISMNNYNLAASELNSFRKEWKTTQFYWSIIIDHIEIDSIDSSLSKLEKCIYVRNKDMSLVELSALRQSIKHIPSKETFTLKNIL